MHRFTGNVKVSFAHRRYIKDYARTTMTFNAYDTTDRKSFPGAVSLHPGQGGKD